MLQNVQYYLIFFNQHRNIITCSKTLKKNIALSHFCTVPYPLLFQVCSPLGQKVKLFRIYSISKLFQNNCLKIWVQLNCHLLESDTFLVVPIWNASEPGCISKTQTQRNTAEFIVAKIAQPRLKNTNLTWRNKLEYPMLSWDKKKGDHRQGHLLDPRL